MFPTPYTISTITATGCINNDKNYEINLDKLYDVLSPLQNHLICDNTTSGISYIEYGKKKTDAKWKGFSKKSLINRRKKTENKRFDNQLTVVYKMVEILDKKTKISHLNTKIFKNGNIQITGIKHPDQGKIIINHVINWIISIYSNDCGIYQLKPNAKSNNKITSVIENIEMSNFEIVLINCNYVVGFKIKRDNLYRLLIEKYNLGVNYEPCIYPGVKVKYFYNTKNTVQDGICKCSTNCERGKGLGNGDGDCKKITISVFQSGCIIITGARDVKQINYAYDMINSILSDNINIIRNPINTITPNQNRLENSNQKNTKVILNSENIKKFTCVNKDFLDNFNYNMKIC